nr:cellulose synthase-like protein H1 [Ipomoea batatas]
MAAKHPPFPLYEIKFRNNRISRAIEIIILFLLLSLITYRLFSLHTHDHIPCLLALICEAWFTFVWIITVNSKWNQIQTKTYPQRLLQWLGNGTSEFPAVDMFVTTADPELEPPIITVNTVLSLLAVDYPAKKLACYVSDDGASPLTFYSLVQASNFAKLWVPFCKKYNIADEYSNICGKIVEASEESVSHEFIDEFSVFANIDRRDHPAIIKVIWENKESVDNGDGIAGIQGSFYMGTGCFHRRKVIYGMWPHMVNTNGKSTGKEPWEMFGKSKIFSLSTTQILSGSLYPEIPIFPNSLEAAKEVASCGYESGTAWGQKVGWLVVWKCSRRHENWDKYPRKSDGLLEILICKKSPIVWALFGRLHFRQFLAYLWIMGWPIRPFFEICYALLPAYCIINNSHFQPKINEGAIIIPASIFIIYNLYTLSEYIRAGESLRAWWNNQRMWKVYASGSWLLGFLSGVVKVFGLSETVFEVTKKDHMSDETLDKDDDSNVGRFTFDESPLFVPGTTILLVNLAALFIGILDFKQNKSRSWSLGEGICSVWVILMYWAFLKGLFGKGKYGIPLSTIVKSVGLALLFVHACKRAN